MNFTYKNLFLTHVESSHRDDSNKWSNIGFGEEIGITGIRIHILSGTLSLSNFPTCTWKAVVMFAEKREKN